MDNIELHRTARALSRDLMEAIACYETFVPTGRDRSVIDQVNRHGINPGFNVISESLHRSALLALYRLWDNRKDTANIQGYARALMSGKAQADLKSIGRPIDRTELAGWQRDIKTVLASEEWEAVKALRDRALAHTASPNKLYQGKARQALYGDERRVLEMTIPIIAAGNRFIGYSLQRPMSELRNMWIQQATNFWRHAAMVDP